ncbi:hypothetical protein [Kitasatospora sp. MAP5-34]|uniref:hypothetical protein n=1 Tax=Kitasatospora sp. MAP5-34 TaxID=3035102 RepID=UPI002473A963|nr:hypothetical protein [Kitasatospora sp. MAP5-34]MDH6577068.1 hypothetical protein [Kitasatospora sp. MAP5-34]
MQKKLISGILVSSIVAAGMVTVAGPASADALPQQKVAATQSLASATVLTQAGAQPQFWHAVVNEATKAAAVVNAAAATYKATAKVVEVTTKVRSSSSESSSSSSGGPVTAPLGLHGVIAGDAQFDYAG